MKIFDSFQKFLQKPAATIEPKDTKISDGFNNLLKGIGGSKDPRMNASFTRDRILDKETLSVVYAQNWLAAKVVDAPVDDATREWIEIISEGEDDQQVDTVTERIKCLELKTKLNTAFKWARVYGGAAIVIIIDGDDITQPLDIETIRPGSLSNFVVLDRYNAYPDKINRDVLHPNFGMPDDYILARAGVNAHYTRVIRVPGVLTTFRDLEIQQYWGNSVFTRILDPIMDSQSVSNNIASMIYEANVDVYKIKGLNTLVASSNEKKALARIELAHKMKSSINGIALDAEDGYEKKSNVFTQLPEIDDRFLQKVAGASAIPATRLLGTAPAGMNATGESDMRNYYESVGAFQNNQFAPALDYSLRIISRDLGLKEDIQYRFHPLQQLTKKEQAEVDFLRAQRDTAYMTYNVLQPSHVMAELAKQETYGTITPEVAEAAAKEEEDFNGPETGGDTSDQ
ncbi:MAG: hypothetical protein DRJ03_03290 [Chloroflexi bacterium]|nr:MAG: hypothetical protein DRJ03_03290 [Chloroflexota bacterium]